MAGRARLETALRDCQEGPVTIRVWNGIRRARSVPRFDPALARAASSTPPLLWRKADSPWCLFPRLAVLCRWGSCPAARDVGLRDPIACFGPELRSRCRFGCFLVDRSPHAGAPPSLFQLASALSSLRVLECFCGIGRL